MNMNVSFLSRRLVRIRAKDLYPLCFVPEPRSSYFLIAAVPKLFFLCKSDLITTHRFRTHTKLYKLGCNFQSEFAMQHKI